MVSSLGFYQLCRLLQKALLNVLGDFRLGNWSSVHCSKAGSSDDTGTGPFRLLHARAATGPSGERGVLPRQGDVQ